MPITPIPSSHSDKIERYRIQHLQPIALACIKKFCTEKSSYEGFKEFLLSKPDDPKSTSEEIDAAVNAGNLDQFIELLTAPRKSRELAPEMDSGKG
jgi:hypothetical protein